MANKFVSSCARIANDKDLAIATVADFWRAVGRPDLALFLEHHLGPTYREVLHIAVKAIARRAGLSPPSRPDPLRRFTFVAADRRSLHHYWELHDTKGWRHSRITASEAKYYTETHHIPILTKFPLSERRAA